MIDFETNEQETAVTTQAIIDLTEANVSANGYGDEWRSEVGFLRDSAEPAEPAASFATDLGDVIDYSTALA